jgi:hypothetical protein
MFQRIRSWDGKSDANTHARKDNEEETFERKGMFVIK